MIPKVFHYCWFGGNPLNAVALNCIESWKKYCPDYKIICWDENNFDINCNIYVKEAYESKKWAFVSDYVRLWVLYNYGGVYVDADVELLKNIDNLLLLGDVVTGYQEDITIPAALMAANKNNEWIKKQLDYYTDRHFINEKGNCDLTTNSIVITKLSAKEFDFKIGDQKIEKGNVILLPTDYLAPRKRIKKISKKSSGKDIYDIDKEHSYAIHHAVGSWTPSTKREKIKTVFFCAMRILLTERVYTKIKGKIMLKRMGI